MEVNTEVNFHQEIVDFIIIKHPELSTSNFNLKVLGKEAPTTFIILVQTTKQNQDGISPFVDVSLVSYECYFNCEIPKSQTNISEILQLGTEDGFDGITKDGEEICYASLSSDRQFLALTILNKKCEDISYTCCIVNVSAVSYVCKLTKLHVLQPFKKFSRIQFIQTPAINIRTKSLLTHNHAFVKLQYAHIIFSVNDTLIKYQRLLISPTLAIIENDNTISSKLHYHDLKSELDRLYILERNSVGRFNLKAFQVIWPQSEPTEIPSYEFQLLFSYQLQLPNQQIQGSLINAHVLEHSNGVICFCYELSDRNATNTNNTYAYCVHLISSNTIIECRTPAYVTDPPGQILFTMYKSYLVVITKYFVHLIDIYCHAKQICSYIWSTCFNESQFRGLQCLNALKLAKMYFLQSTNCVISMTPNLFKIASMISESSSVTQKVGALNFIVFNHLRNSRENIPQFAIERVIFHIRNSFTMSRLMEEYITASVNRYIRIKVSQEKIMRLVDNTTLSSQFSIKLSAIVNPEDVIIDNDLIKINLQTVNKDALVIFVKETLPIPQTNRFLRLASEASCNKTKFIDDCIPYQFKFDIITCDDEPDMPSYLADMSLSDEQILAVDRLILQNFGSISKSDAGNLKGFVEKVRSCTIRSWRKLLFLMHKTVFGDEDTLWNDLRLLKRQKNCKITGLHSAIGAFRYVLLKERLTVPSTIEDLYCLTSYNVLSNERFLIYITYADFLCASSLSLEFFKEFYRQLVEANPINRVSLQIKERLLAKMSIKTKMEVLHMLNQEDQSRVLREYWDNINQETKVFNKYYGEIIQNISKSCETPQNALDQFYRQSAEKIQLHDSLK